MILQTSKKSPEKQQQKRSKAKIFTQKPSHIQLSFRLKRKNDNCPVVPTTQKKISASLFLPWVLPWFSFDSPESCSPPTHLHGWHFGTKGSKVAEVAPFPLSQSASLPGSPKVPVVFIVVFLGVEHIDMEKRHHMILPKWEIRKHLGFFSTICESVFVLYNFACGYLTYPICILRIYLHMQANQYILYHIYTV